jgi:6-phosphogluconolactonase (cycloisomerase 2 family)
MSQPGPVPDRQDAPHPHEALVDPTDSFILVPDLGADLVRIFTIDPATSNLTETTPFNAAPGSGPRHGGFLVSGCTTYFFLTTELGNTVSSYAVTYGDGTLTFDPVSSSGVFGNMTVPEGTAAAEAVVSVSSLNFLSPQSIHKLTSAPQPDGKFLLTSARNATLFNIPNFDPTNSTKIPSDTLQSWAIDGSTGKLTFDQLAPAGGSFPRQFSVNKDGSLAAVGLQYDSRVVVIERDVASGKLGKFVAEIDIPGQITSVIFDD